MKKNRPAPFFIALVAAGPLLTGAPVVEARQVEAPEHGPVARHSQRDRGYLGVSVRPLNSDLRRHFGAPSDRGVLIASIEPEGPAAAAGLAVGDVIVAVDGRRIGSVGSLHHVVRANREVEIEFYRDGERRAVDVALETRRADAHDWEGDWEDWAEGWAGWGEQWGEGWAEWGERFGERWAELGAEMGEHWAEHGAEWGEVGAEIGARMSEAFAEMDWSEMDRALEESMRALDEVDWDEIGDELERALEEVEDALDKALEETEKKERKQ